MTTFHLGTLDDFCVYFLLERQAFPVKVSKIFGRSTNPIIDVFSRIKFDRELAELLRIARLGKAEQREQIIALLGYYKDGKFSVVNLLEQEGFLQLFGCYLSLYSPRCAFDVATTAKYNPNRRECCVVARRDIPARTMLTGLCGIFCPLDDDALQRLTEEDCDFSVMYSETSSKEGIFIGPARFVNHDCNPNCEFVPQSKNTVCIRAIKDIKLGQELTIFYEKGYFGPNNEDCLCDSCKAFPKALVYADFCRLRKREHLKSSICGTFVCYCTKCKGKNHLDLAMATLDMQFLMERNMKIFQKRWPFR